MPPSPCKHAKEAHVSKSRRCALPRSLLARTALGVLLLCGALTTDAAAPIRLPLPWTKGMQVSYRSEAVAEKSRGGTHQELRTREVLRIEVTQAGDDGIVQVWHNLDPVVEGSGDAPNLPRELAAAQALSKTVGAIAYEVQLNAKGEFQGLRNWEELATAMRGVLLPALVEQARARPELAKLDDASLRARIEPVLVRNSGRNATNASLGREAAIFNYFTGAGMTPGQRREYDDNVASPWSGDLIPTHGSFEIAAVDDKAGTVSIRWTQDMDAEKAREVVIRNVEAATGKPIPPEARGVLPRGVRLSDRALVVLDRASGLPLSLDHVREVEFGGGSSRNHWTLERIPEQTDAAPGGAR
jgi:hypothetical protein